MNKLQNKNRRTDKIQELIPRHKSHKSSYFNKEGGEK